jgi:hypothetical protein
MSSSRYTHRTRHHQLDHFCSLALVEGYRSSVLDIVDVVCRELNLWYQIVRINERYQIGGETIWNKIKKNLKVNCRYLGLFWILVFKFKFILIKIRVKYSFDLPNIFYLKNLSLKNVVLKNPYHKNLEFFNKKWIFKPLNLKIHI